MGVTPAYARVRNRRAAQGRFIDDLDERSFAKVCVLGHRLKRRLFGTEDAPADSGKGFLQAWDPINQKRVWKVDLPPQWNAGTMTTKGNLVFEGMADGEFAAFDARDGKKLWSMNMGLGISAPPVTYTVDGKQFDLKMYSGKPTVLFYFATNGVTTAGDVATLKQVQAKYARDINVVGISLPLVRELLLSLDLAWPRLWVDPATA